MNKLPVILAVESSCDETAAAIVTQNHEGKITIVSSLVSSQADLHAKTGGVVPEVASRAHMEAIIPVISGALNLAAGRLNNNESLPDNITDQDQRAISFLHSAVTHIAVTSGPGLIGSLLVGFNAAKALTYATNKPLIPIHHIEGHLYSALCADGRAGEDRRFEMECGGDFKFPLLALVVSGGHTSLILMREHGQYQVIGQTLDDAAGEAFDKVAKLLDLGYPGGPVVSRVANEHRERSQDANSLVFPRPLINERNYNFSFSGLKTAVLKKVRDISGLEGSLTDDTKARIAAAFEDAVVDVLVAKTLRAAEEFGPKTIVLAGGVAANKQLRSRLEASVGHNHPDVDLRIPPLSLCGDNAAMIGLAALHRLETKADNSWKEAAIDSNLELI
ncbi:MAG: tRNA N6-adenosine threonylcarbamoyltransferase [bacterium ADurb.Bin400]|nr:MAG: tRNA N6-adenosine threonylcarbamoyltransferase [bacterium ADurb.Bin400]